MKAALLLTLVLTASLALSGCGGKSGGGAKCPDGQTDCGTPLKSGKGAVTGLVLDDALRPVPGALVLMSNGITGTSATDGAFTIADLEPGSYILRVQADGHEAAPQPVDVVEGEYTELEVIARRVANAASRIITNEFSVFIPCAAGFVANGITLNCVGDLSGDSYRSSFDSNLTSEANVTFMVTEWKFNKVGDWNAQIREADGPSGGERYAVLDIDQGDYGKVVLQKGVLNTEANAQRNNVPWNNTKVFQTGIFLNGQFKDEAQGAFDALPVCSVTTGLGEPTLCTATGVGVELGVKARIIQSVFIGPPDVDVLTYGVLD